jgi:hypothetical protein
MKKLSLGRITARRFMLASMLFLLMGVIEGLMQPTKFAFKDLYVMVLGLEPNQIKPFFGNFVSKIHTHVSLVGWVSTGLMGLFYFAAEEISRGSNCRPYLCLSNLVLQVGGVLLLAIGFHLVGIVALPTGHPEGSPEFRAAAQGVKPLVVAGGVTLLASCLIFIYNMCSTLLGRSNGST